MEGINFEFSVEHCIGVCQWREVERKKNAHIMSCQRLCRKAFTFGIRMVDK